MGGKTAQTTQQVSIPPDVLARYNSVNAQAQTAAATPFQAYSGEFTAPVNATQQAGVNQTQQYSQTGQPYFQAGAGLTANASQGVGPLTQAQIQQYQNPYIQSVVNPTLQALQQQQGQQTSSLMNPQSASAFGGDRSGLVADNLARQQLLGTQQAIAPLYQQGYTQAVQTAVGQQGVEAQNLARELQAGQGMANIGTAAQTAGLQGAQAVMGAGTLQQQTQQALDTAQYNQFLQERGYPFQVAQFLAGIAEGTGANSGSTTTTTQPAPFFASGGSVRDPDSMGGVVNNPGKYASGGTVADRNKYAGGGYINLGDIGSILAAQSHFQSPQQGGGMGGGGIGGSGYVPQVAGSSARLATASGMPRQQESVLKEGLGVGSQIAGLYKSGKGFGQDVGWLPKDNQSGSGPANNTKSSPSPQSLSDAAKSLPQAEWKQDYDISPPTSNIPMPAPRPDGYAGGGLVPRHGYATAGSVDPYEISSDPMSDVVAEGQSQNATLKPAGAPPSQQPGVGKQILGAAEGLGALGSAGSMIGSAASGIGSGISAALPFLMALKDGGSVNRHGYADGGNPDTSDSSVTPADKNTVPAPVPGVVPSKAVPAQGPSKAEPPAPTPGVVPSKAAPDDPIIPIMSVTRQMESSNNYDTIGKIPNSKGDVPYGAYGVMGENIPSWSKEILGHSMTPDEFLLNHRAQDTIAYAKMSQYYNQHGQDPQQVFSLWHSGTTLDKAQDRVDNAGTRTPDYVNKASQYLGLIPPEAAPPARTPSNTPNALGGSSYLDTLANKYMAPGGTGTPQAAPDQGGVSGLLGSEKFWIPLLSGLGDMASSKSRHLGTAILQGIGGGAQTYGALEQQQAQRGLEQQKINIDQAKAGVEALKFVQSRYAPIHDESGNITGYKDTMGSGQNLTLEQHDAAVRNVYQSFMPSAASSSATPGATQLPYAAGAKPADLTTGTSPLPSGPVPVKPVSGGTQQAAAEEKPAPTTKALPKSLDLSDDEAVKAEIQKQRSIQFSSTGDDAAAHGKIADQLMAGLMARTNASAEDINKNNIANYNNYSNEAKDRAKNYGTAMNNADSLASIYANSSPGRGAEWKADLAGWASSLGFHVSEDDLKNAANFDSAMKTTSKIMIGELTSAKMTRAPAASLSALQKIVASPNLQPGAVFELIASMKADELANRVRDNYFAENASAGIDTNKLMMKFDRENPDLIKKSMAQSLNMTPDPANIDSETKERLAKIYPGYDPTKSKALRDTLVAKGAPAATAANPSNYVSTEFGSYDIGNQPPLPPPPLAGMNLQWKNTNGKIEYRDKKTGAIYDENGKVVFMPPQVSNLAQ